MTVSFMTVVLLGTAAPNLPAKGSQKRGSGAV